MDLILIKQTHQLQQIITITLEDFGKMGLNLFMVEVGIFLILKQTPTCLVILCFQGDTDPLGWGDRGNPQAPWTEQTSNNTPNDRRFVQSAGPFVLKPGAINNITVGVVYARASGGNPFESVEVLRRADDKAQSLFENCFKVLDGLMHLS